MTVFKDVSGASVQPDLADDRPAEAASFVSPPLPGESIVEGWVTSYEVVDKTGDIGTFGMFAATLKKFRDQNKRIPVTDSHDWSSKGIIGYALPTEVVEVRKGGPGKRGGLFARMHLLTEDSKTAAFLYKLMQELPLQMSYSFDSVSERSERTGLNKKANRLLSVQLLEICVCLFGAVEQTSVHARKQREAIMRMPEYKSWVEKKRREVGALVLSADLLTQDRPHRAGAPRGSVSAAGQGYDAVADFEAFALGYENDADPVRMFNRVVRQVEAKAAESNAGPREGEYGNAVVEPDYSQGQCVRCGAFITTPPRKNPGGFGYLHSICPKCSTVLFDWDDTKGLTPRQLALEDARLKTRYKDQARSCRMAAEDRVRRAKMQRRRDVDELVKFANTPARPSKSDVKAVIDTFDAVLTKKKSTANPLDGIEMPGGRGEPHV